MACLPVPDSQLGCLRQLPPLLVSATCMEYGSGVEATRPPDPIPEFHPVQIAAWRKLSPDQKWTLARGALRMVREAARRRLARQHPDWTPAQVEQALSRHFIRART